MEDKETVYDEQIAPHMNEIIRVCKEHQIPFFASFQYNDENFCSSGGRLGGHVVFNYLEAVRQCIHSDGFNIDKLMFWVMKNARSEGHSSIILKQLGVPLRPDEVINEAR